MSEFAFKEETALGGFHKDYDGVALAEISDRAIVSIATPRQGETRLAEALTAAFGVGYPSPGKSNASSHRNSRLLGLGADQLFAVFDHPGPFPEKAIASDLGDAAYFVDQSDAWVVVSISGPRAREALERICPIDLDPGVFTEGSVASTVMEHLSAIICREGADAFLLLSPRSSAKSFLHALETSIENVI